MKQGLTLFALLSLTIGLGNANLDPSNPLFLNQFMKNCFEERTDMNWRSIIDFVIFHSSWYENSDVGACAANNPDVVSEALCWQEAFALLITPNSPFLNLSRICANNYVIATHSGQESLPEEEFDSDAEYHSTELNRKECPFVDEFSFSELVRNRTGGISNQFSLNDKTLTDFESIIDFVESTALCTEPTCDLCSLNYLSSEYPTSELECDECWPTRLAGIIKDSSPLKQIVTQIAFDLGNNQPVSPPPPELNLFFASCLNNSEYLSSSNSWKSLVDFVILHTSWFENSNRGSCRPGNPDLIQETGCWLDAYGHLIAPSQLLDASRECVIAFANVVGNFTEETIGMLLDGITNPLGFDEEGRVPVNSQRCPYVDPDEFLRVFEENLALSSSNSDFGSSDQTLQDFRFVIDEVMTRYLCLMEVCDSCTVSYPPRRVPFQRSNNGNLACCSCWPTRLAGLIKNSSPLKQPATDAALYFEPN